MFQFYAIIIIGLAHAADRGYVMQVFGEQPLPDEVRWSSAILPILCTLAVQWLAARFALARVEVRSDADRPPRSRMNGAGWLLGAERTLLATQWIILLTYAFAVLVCGWHAQVQDWWGGDVILADLLLTILPPVAGLWLSWAIHYPVMRRIRDAIALRALDEGEVVHAPPSRWRYSLLQMRLHVLFMLVPLLVIVTWSDTVELWLPARGGGAVEALLNEALTLVGAIVVFAFAPVMARVILTLRPMPSGPVRDDLLQICHDHRVRVRDVLLWDTDGAMINGAVMGIIGRLRYVMLTDALLESMRREQVLAVMAHEIGHVRRHHIPWMIGALMSALLLPSFIADAVLRMLVEGQAISSAPPWWTEAPVMIAIIAFAFFSFGWVSRRFERQADSFAVQHLSGLREARGGRDAGEIIAPEAAHAMNSALETVSRLNGINPNRRSWRHGSIRWRQRYVAGLVGRPVRGLPIDRKVRLIKVGVAVVLLLLVPLIVRDIVVWAEPPPPPAPVIDPMNAWHEWFENSLRE